MNPSITSPAEAEPVGGKRSRKLFWAIAVLSVAGILVSAISLERHYAKSATSFCEFGQKFDCDIVNRSEYSSIMGIPIAGIGVLGYGLLLALSTLYQQRAETPTRLLLASAVGLAFALYLTYVEAYLLETWCILCLSSLALITIITLFAAILKFKAARGST
jgi:vitamin-K-epoxide reductase (warfarin-sensitive)